MAVCAPWYRWLDSDGPLEHRLLGVEHTVLLLGAHTAQLLCLQILQQLILGHEMQLAIDSLVFALAIQNDLLGASLGRAAWDLVAFALGLSAPEAQTSQQARSAL